MSVTLKIVPPYVLLSDPERTVNCDAIALQQTLADTVDTTYWSDQYIQIRVNHDKLTRFNNIVCTKSLSHKHWFKFVYKLSLRINDLFRSLFFHLMCPGLFENNILGINMLKFRG